jgi:hypothetical protein
MIDLNSMKRCNMNLSPEKVEELQKRIDGVKEQPQCAKCQVLISPLEVELWKTKCHRCAARAYKFVISKLYREIEDLKGGKA